jgi:hypothetical protein
LFLILKDKKCKQMKKVFSLLALILFCGLANSQDLTFDSVRVTSPYWGAEVETFTATSWDNCGSNNTIFINGQTARRIKFPINIVNFGTQPAFLGDPGVTPGVNYNWTQPGCWTQTIHNVNAPVNIDNFVTMRVLDECKNVMFQNQKTAWYFQNNGSYAVDKSFGQWVYYTNVFGQQPTTGNDPNPTKDWIESICGTIDTNKAIIGGQLLFAWDSNCQQCDSLILFPNHYSSEQKGEVGTWIQIPEDLQAGNYYLELDGDFSRFETEDCLPNKITFPFTFDGNDGFVTFQSQDHTCNQATNPPSTPTNVSAYANDFGRGSITQTVTVIVNFDKVDDATSYIVTPYVIVQGNGEKAVTSLAQVFEAGSPQPDRWAVSFSGPNLRAADEVVAFFSGDRKNLKFRFKVEAVNAAGVSSPGTSGNPTVNVK